ncbi:MAG: mechanosensitive ion channel family protein [Propylenella sp.]
MELTQAPERLDALAAMLWSWSEHFLPRLGAALIILIVGFLVARWASRAAFQLVGRTERVDRTLRPVIQAVVRYAILAIVLVAALGQLGVQTASVLAALAAVGLAIGLALQGTLSNIAAGIMLLWLRPFEVGDYIETSSVAGTVEELGLFATQIRTWDGIFKFVPNSTLWNTTVTNYTRNPTRLVLLEFGIAYEDDIAEARRILTEVAEEHPDVLGDPPPVVVPLSLADSAVVLQLRAWAPTSIFWDVRWALTETGKKRLDEAGISIPFPQRVVHVVSAEGRKPPPGALTASE